MWRECEASPFLTEHAERLVQIWLARADRTAPGLVWVVPDPVPLIMRPWREDELPTFEPIKTTHVGYHGRVGDDHVFLFGRDGETVYYCPRTGKFLEKLT